MNTTVEDGFTKIGEIFGMHVFVMNRKADYNKTMELLHSKGFRAMEYGEVIAFFSKEKDLRAKFISKWFWLAGRELNKSGLYFTDKNGKIIENGGTPPEKMDNTVQLHRGSGPLCMSIGKAYMLRADTSPLNSATIILGIMEDVEKVRELLIAECKSAKDEKGSVLRRYQ